MTVAAESVHKRRYTEIAVGTRIRYRDEREYVEHYIHLLRECVHSRLRCAGPVAVSMSGGLDSTAVAALAACQLGARSTGQRILASYSYAFDEFPTCDERKYIEPVVEQHKLDAHYVPCDERWTFADWEEWPFDREFILSDPFTLLPLAVIEAASQDRCRLLLGGYFGDVLFSGGNYWLLGLVREFRLLQLGAIVRESAGEIRWRRSLGDFGLRRLMPVRWRRTFRTVMPRKLQMAHPGIHDDLVRRTDLHNRTASYGWWERLNRDEDSQRFHSLMLCVFSQGAAATRWMYNQYGIELETPYWDRRLIEFAMALPADQLGRPGWDRWLHRRAMKGILPESVSKRREKTSFESLLRKGISEREHQLRELLQKPAVVERRYIQADWLREQLESPDRQAYFTVNFWTCVCLEGWLSRVE